MEYVDETYTHEYQRKLFENKLFKILNSKVEQKKELLLERNLYKEYFELDNLNEFCRLSVDVIDVCKVKIQNVTGTSFDMLDYIKLNNTDDYSICKFTGDIVLRFDSIFFGSNSDDDDIEYLAEETYEKNKEQLDMFILNMVTTLDEFINHLMENNQGIKALENKYKDNKIKFKIKKIDSFISDSKDNGGSKFGFAILCSYGDVKFKIHSNFPVDKLETLYLKGLKENQFKNIVEKFENIKLKVNEKSSKNVVETNRFNSPFVFESSYEVVISIGTHNKNSTTDVILDEKLNRDLTIINNFAQGKDLVSIVEMFGEQCDYSNKFTMSIDKLAKLLPHYTEDEEKEFLEVRSDLEKLYKILDSELPSGIYKAIQDFKQKYPNGCGFYYNRYKDSGEVLEFYPIKVLSPIYEDGRIYSDIYINDRFRENGKRKEHFYLEMSSITTKKRYKKAKIKNLSNEQDK